LDGYSVGGVTFKSHSGSWDGNGWRSGIYGNKSGSSDVLGTTRISDGEGDSGKGTASVLRQYTEVVRPDQRVRRVASVGSLSITTAGEESNNSRVSVGWRALDSGVLWSNGEHWSGGIDHTEGSSGGGGVTALISSVELNSGETTANRASNWSIGGVSNT